MKTAPPTINPGTWYYGGDYSREIVDWETGHTIIKINMLPLGPPPREIADLILSALRNKSDGKEE